MRETKLGIILPHNFKGKFLFAIEEKWKDFFTDNLAFEVLLDKNSRLTLRGPVVQSSQHDPTAEQEETT